MSVSPFSWMVGTLMALPALAGTANMVQNHQTTYFWTATQASQTAPLLTLSCTHCGADAGTVPLLAVLRDRLADAPGADRITDIWLLSDSPLTFRSRLLGAVPFFYWRVGNGSTKVPHDSLKPLLDLNTPEQSVVSGLGRNLLQTTVLDPAALPVRATSHAYRANELDRERLHLQEAISFVRLAPIATAEQDGITKSEQDFLIARLELRKRLLGGLVPGRNAGQLGEQVSFEMERVRSRNWELLRQTAEKTGLTFEPLTIAGVTGEYAMLTFSPRAQLKPEGVDLSPVWKLLNLRDPWTDEHLKQRIASGDESAIPIGVYSLEYPAMPLLLIDFRGTLRIRKHEMTQRSINEIVSGVVGLSHFTNWYYYAGSFLYDFVRARRGTATNQAERLDSYSSLRVALALDQNLDPDLRSDMQRRLSSLALNPLDGSPAAQLRIAKQRSLVLTEAAENGRLAQRLDDQRRAELASLRSSAHGRWFSAFLHASSFGLYTRRAGSGDESLEALKRERQIQTNLALLDGLPTVGGAPEIVFDAERLQQSVNQLAEAVPYVKDAALRRHVEKTLTRLRDQSDDAALQRQCSMALNQINAPARLPIAASVRASARSFPNSPPSKTHMHASDGE